MSDLGRIQPLNPSWPIRRATRSGPHNPSRQPHRETGDEPVEEEHEDEERTREPHIDELA